jgi:hypothetical protein
MTSPTLGILIYKMDFLFSLMWFCEDSMSWPHTQCDYYELSTSRWARETAE